MSNRNKAAAAPVAVAKSPKAVAAPVASAAPTVAKPVKLGKAKAEKSTEIVISVPKGALSTDVGPKVLASIASTVADDIKVRALEASLEKRRKDARAQMTMAILRAVAADPTGFNLSAAFGEADNAADKAAYKALLKRTEIMLGVREYVDKTNEKTGEAVQVYAFTAAAAKFMPDPSVKLKKDGEAEYAKRRANLQNFEHMVKDCLQSAAAIVDNKMKAEFVEKEGTLRLSGPAVASSFGMPSVTLNDVQKVSDGKKEVLLKVKPSFAALKSIAKNARKPAQVPVSRGPNSAATVGSANASSAEAFAAMCSSVIAALNKLPVLSDEHKRTLAALKVAVDAKIGA